VLRGKIYKEAPFRINKMSRDDDFEDDEFSAQAEDEAEEDDLVEDDEMSAGEDGFLRGYNEEAELDETEEEEL
jgi:hypothetical protein